MYEAQHLWVDDAPKCWASLRQPNLRGLLKRGDGVTNPVPLGSLILPCACYAFGSPCSTITLLFPEISQEAIN